jgi:hypothetical protein
MSAPRLDQLEAVMKKHRCTLEEAREICVRNFEAWRDRPRYWKWIQTDAGGYAQVEDTDGPLPWSRRESLRRINRVIASVRRS